MVAVIEGLWSAVRLLSDEIIYLDAGQAALLYEALADISRAICKIERVMMSRRRGKVGLYLDSPG